MNRRVSGSAGTLWGLIAQGFILNNLIYRLQENDQLLESCITPLKKSLANLFVIFIIKDNHTLTKWYWNKSSITAELTSSSRSQGHIRDISYSAINDNCSIYSPFWCLAKLKICFKYADDVIQAKFQNWDHRDQVIIEQMVRSMCVVFWLTVVYIVHIRMCAHAVIFISCLMRALYAWILLKYQYKIS